MIVSPRLAIASAHGRSESPVQTRAPVITNEAGSGGVGAQDKASIDSRIPRQAERRETDVGFFIATFQYVPALASFSP